MIIRFEGAGERRRELVKAISEATGMESVYQGAPGFAYKVGPYAVLRDGSLEVADLMDEKEIGLLLHALRAKGFIAIGDEWARPEEPPAAEEIEAANTETGVDGIAIAFPKDMNAHAVNNLRRLVEGKAWLIKQALNVEKLPIEEGEDTLSFPWLPGTTPRELVNATICLIAALIRLAKKLKRVTLVANETDNPRYALRCFLLRLGFIGPEHKAVRKALMDGVPGNGSKRYLAIEEPVSDDIPVEVEPLEKLEQARDIVSQEELDALEKENASRA